MYNEEVEQRYKFLSQITNIAKKASTRALKQSFSEKFSEIFKITRTLFSLKLAKNQNFKITIEQIHSLYNMQPVYPTHLKYGFSSFFIIQFNQNLPSFYQIPQASALYVLTHFNNLEKANSRNRESIFQYFAYHTFPSIYHFFVYKETLQAGFLFLKQVINGVTSPVLATHLVSSFLLSAYQFNSTFWRRIALTFAQLRQYDFQRMHSYFLTIINETSFLLPSEYVTIMTIFKDRFREDFVQWFISSFFLETFDMHIQFTYKFHDQNQYNQLRNYLNDLLKPVNQAYALSILECFSANVGSDCILPSIQHEIVDSILNIVLSGNDVFILNDIFTNETSTKINSSEFLFNFQIQTNFSDKEKSSIQDLIGPLPQPLPLPIDKDQEKMWDFVTNSSIYRNNTFEERLQLSPKFPQINQIYFKNKEIPLFIDSLERLNFELTLKKQEGEMNNLKNDINDIYFLYFSHFASIDSNTFIPESFTTNEIMESIRTNIIQKGINKGCNCYFWLWLNVLDSLEISFDNSIKALDKQFWNIINSKLREFKVDQWDVRLLLNMTKLMKYFSFFQDFHGQGYGKRLNFICYFMKNAKLISSQHHKLWNDVFVYFLAQIKDIPNNEVFETFLFLDAFIFIDNSLCISFGKEIMNNWLSFSNSMLSLITQDKELIDFYSDREKIIQKVTIKRKIDE